MMVSVSLLGCSLVGLVYPLHHTIAHFRWQKTELETQVRSSQWQSILRTYASNIVHIS